MHKLTINALVLAAGCAFGAGAMADMSKDDYQAGKEKSRNDYKTAKAACDAFSGNARDICVAEAKGREKLERADLEASLSPTVYKRYKARVAAAEADYAVAKERCDDKAGTAKDVCVEEAKAVQTTAKAEAKAQMKIADANAIASGKTVEAREDARNKSAEARKDAATATNDAQYGVAKEKCDTYAGAAKDHCLLRAKENFGKP